MLKHFLRLFIALGLVWLLALPTLADLTGDLQGTVTDAMGAGVPNAKVTLKSLRTGATRVLSTSATGEFSAPQLEVGDYFVSIEKDGFKSFTQNAAVRSAEKTRIDARLEIGNVSQTVSVESSALPVLDVATAQVSDSINAQETLAMPNQARDPVVLQRSLRAPCQSQKTIPSSGLEVLTPMVRAAGRTILPLTVLPPRTSRRRAKAVGWS
jgi:hypothetical protein